jgi:hypothetical protein
VGFNRRVHRCFRRGAFAAQPWFNLGSLRCQLRRTRVAGFPPAWLNWAVDPKTRQRVLDLPSNILGLRMIRRRKLDGRFMLSSHARGRVTTAERETCRVRTSRIRLKNGARDVTVRPSSSRDGDGVGWVLLLILGDVPFGKIVGWRIVYIALDPPCLPVHRHAKRPQQPHSVCLFICILDRAPHPTRKERRTSQAPFCISFVVRFVGSAHDAVSSCGAALSLPPQRLGWRSRRDAEHRSAARLITRTGAGEVVWAAPTDQPAGSPTNPGRYRRARNPIPIARSRTGHAAPVIRTGLNRIGTPISVAMRLRAEPRRARPEPASTGRA